MGSFLVVDCPLLHQQVVIRLKSVFHDGGKGDGLLNPFAVFLNLCNQFHNLIRNADAELFRCVRMIFDHLLQGGLGGLWQGRPPAEEEIRECIVEPLEWVSGGMLEGFGCPLQSVKFQATSASISDSSRGGIEDNCTSNTFPKRVLSSEEVMLRSN